MKVKDIILEDDLNNFSDSAHAAMPNATVWPDLDNSSPYHAFRFGVALAGSPDKVYPKDGPTGQKMVTVAYTQEEQEILKHTGKKMGFKGKHISNPPSEETADVSKASPVPQNSGKNIKRKS
jgi:hypothetical protein